jgi:hypothetical protein
MTSKKSQSDKDMDEDNDPKLGSFKFRKGLVDVLANEIGKSVYKQFTQNEKYCQHNLSYLELKQLIDSMYATIYGLLYEERYGKPTAQALMDHKNQMMEHDKQQDKDLEKESTKL